MRIEHAAGAVDAAYIAGHSGQLDQAQRLVRADSVSGVADSPDSVVASGYVALFEDGDVRSSHHQVFAAVETLRDRGVGEPDEVLTRLVDLLPAISQYASDAGAWERVHVLPVKAVTSGGGACWTPRRPGGGAATSTFVVSTGAPQPRPSTPHAKGCPRRSGEAGRARAGSSSRAFRTSPGRRTMAPERTQARVVSSG
ncbi:hypothetical protein [Streptomyces flaveolus]|uniref:hypothetical protein n=1 Tax=Streptomyces flaveolus TaxID=67297 RepID=UPI0037FB12F4